MAHQSDGLPFNVKDKESVGRFAFSLVSAPRSPDLCEYLSHGTAAQLAALEDAFIYLTRRARADADEAKADSTILALDIVRLAKLDPAGAEAFLAWDKRCGLGGSLWLACSTPEKCIWVLQRYGDVLTGTNCFRVIYEQYKQAGSVWGAEQIAYLEKVLALAESEMPEHAVANAGPMPRDEKHELMADFLFDKQLRLAVMAMAGTFDAGPSALKKIIWERRDIILSDLGEEKLGNYIEASLKTGDDSVKYFHFLQEVIMRCREEGIEAAFS